MAKFYTLYNNTPPKVRTINNMASLAVQSAYDETDINNIIHKYGIIASYGSYQCQYGDCINLGSTDKFMKASVITANLRQDFDALPSEERAKYAGSFEEYVEAVAKGESPAADEGETVGTESPLDITVPTDTKSSVSDEKNTTNNNN